MSTGSGLFAFLSRDFDKMFCQIVSVRVKTTIQIASVKEYFKGKRLTSLLPVYVCCSKKSLLNFPISQSKVVCFLLFYSQLTFSFVTMLELECFPGIVQLKKKYWAYDFNFPTTDYCIVDAMQTQ